MKIFTVLLGLAVILFLILGGIVLYVVINQSETGSTYLDTTFTVLKSGTSGGYGYVVYNYRGEGNITIISYDSNPKTNIVVINDSQAIQATQLSKFIEQLMELEKYGYEITVSSEPKIAGDGIYIIPSGALPSYALFDLQQNMTNTTIIYFGAQNLILSTGIKENNWYDQLSPEQRKRIVVYGPNLDLFMDENRSMTQYLLYNSWMPSTNRTAAISGNEVTTAVVDMNESGYIRLVYDVGTISGVYDSPYLMKLGQEIVPNPPSIYPWEKSALQFELNRTNGTAILTVQRDGNVIETRQLSKVTDENVFIQTFEYETPGDYILSVADDSHITATGLLHVKDLEIVLVNRIGNSYIFEVSVDGEPLTNSEAEVWLGNSTNKKRFYITDGELSVSAQLGHGKNTFNFGIDGHVVQVEVTNTQENILEFYIKYGIPGLILVIVVYFGARMTRRPTYRVRFGDSSTYIRQEIKLPLDRALESFKKIREDMHLSGSPITTHEFTTSLKRYLTNGADVTEGNVEEILNKLVKGGYLEAHRDYYQLKGEGDVKYNVLHRMIREKLIESGTTFTEQGEKFILKNMEIGFFTSKFSKKAIIVVDDENGIKHILSSLNENQRARLRIAQTNDMISFVPIDKLSGLL